jgi:hypothetical protein
MQNVRTALAALIAASIAQAHPHSSSCTSTVAAPPAATDSANTQLTYKLQSAPTALNRARQLLVDREALRTREELKKLVVFNFNRAQPASSALGSASKTAISITSTLLSPSSLNALFNAGSYNLSFLH